MSTKPPAPIPPPEDPRPRIRMKDGDIEKVVAQAEDALIAAGSPLYQRGGELVRPVRVGQIPARKDHVVRSPESMVLIPVKEPWLVMEMNRVAVWIKGKKKGADGRVSPAKADPKPIYARSLLGNEGAWKFAPLRGVLNSPTITMDGRVVQAPGYDEGSGLLIDVPKGFFPPVPDEPTKDDAVRALGFLAKPLREMPFADAPARAVALSAMLTSLIRVCIRTAPLHGMDAPTPGTGKSLLAEVIGILANGCLPPAMSLGKTEEETEKRLSTVLHAGDPIIHLDNCKSALEGDFLCSMLSQEFVQARILGLSERRVLPCTSLVIASGNNLTFAGDVSRRAVVCRLDCHLEKPEERKFDWDPRHEVLRARPRFVQAGLTILKAYLQAGTPEKLRPMGSFDDWEIIRGALVWLGQGDPAETRQTISAGDPQRDEMTEIANLWAKAFGTRRVRVSDIDAMASSHEPINEVRNRLADIVCRGTWSGRSVGRWLMRWKDRIVGGRYFTCTLDPKDGHQWELRGAVTEEPGTLFPEPPAEDGGI